MGEANRTILVLENSFGRFEPYTQLLQHEAGFTWQIVDDANAQLLALCEARRVDGILLGFSEINTQGLWVLEQLKGQLGQACPPVITIGENDLNTAVAALKAGAADYLVKDQLTPDALCLAFRTAIENTELKRELQLSHEQFQTSVENMLDCFGVYSAMRDESGRIVDFRVDYVNEATCNANRMTRDQQVGQRLCELLPAHRESGLFDDYCRLVETGEPLVKESIVYEDLFDGERLVRAFDIRANKLNDGFVASWRDITDRKQLELELSNTVANLQQQQNYLQQLLHTAPIGVGIGASSGKVRLINDAMLALHGLTRDDFERDGLNWCDFTPPEYAHRSEPAMAQLQQQGFLPPEEKEILRPDGTRVPVWISATQSSHNPDEHVAFAVDLTAQKQTEAALKASQQRYQQLAEAMPQLVWQADATGAVNYWNQRWYDYTGLSQAETVALGGVDALHPADRDRTLARWQQAITAGEVFEIEHRIRRHDGAYRWFINRGVPTRNDQGQITGWIGTITDIQDQKQLETRFRLVTRAVNGLVYDWDAETNEIYRSEQLFDLIGVRPEEAPPDADWWCDQVHPDDLARLMPKFREAFAGSDEFYESQYRVRHGDGHWVHVWERSCLVRNDQGRVVRIVGSTVDISHHKQTEIALQQNQERLNLAMEAAGIGIWDLNLQTQEVHWCENLQQLFGLAPGSFDGRFETVVDMIHPDDLPRVQTSIRQAVEEGADYNIEFRFMKPDGTVRWAHGLGRVFYDADGNPVEMTGVDMDITERKRVEHELREAHIQLESALVAGSMYTWRWDVLENRVYTNRSFAHLFGVEPDRAAAGLPIEAFLAAICGDDQAKVLAAIRQSLETGEDYVQEYRVCNASGHERWAIARGRVEYDEHGNPVAFPGALADITDRKQTEAALRQYTARLEFVLEANQLGTWEVDLQTQPHVASPRSLRHDQIYGYDSILPEWGYDTFLSHIHPEDRQRVASSFQQTLISHTSWDVECRIFRTDGACRWVWISGDIDFDDAGQPQKLMGIISDITSRKETETALRQSEDRLLLALESEQAARAAAENANRIKDEFLAILSHELRSPLNPILGWANLLQTKKLDADKTARALSTIERNAKLQTQLIDDLLDVARILRGKLKLNKTLVDPAFVIESALETVQAAAANKQISLHTELAEVGQVRGDAGRLQQIVWNLLTNAVKFTPKGGRVEVRLKQEGEQGVGEVGGVGEAGEVGESSDPSTHPPIHPSTSPTSPPQYAQITITDTGIGIRQDFLPHIFDSFRQEDASVTRKFGGLGLGLSIVRYLVEAHGGTIAADSPGEGQGATFTVNLPLIGGEDPRAAVNKPAATDIDLAGVRVLAVDDDPDALELLAVAMEEFGAEIRAVDKPSEVLPALARFKPTVLLCDIGMPNIDGHALIQQIRALPPEQGGQVPAIAVTAYVRDADHQKALDSGFQAHVAKPVALDALALAVAELTPNSNSHAG